MKNNAAMENFFSSLKTERTARKDYSTRDAAKADVFDYIERYYNLRRRHSTLGYLSPVAYEEPSSSSSVEETSKYTMPSVVFTSATRN